MAVVMTISRRFHVLVLTLVLLAGAWMLLHYMSLPSLTRKNVVTDTRTEAGETRQLNAKSRQQETRSGDEHKLKYQSTLTADSKTRDNNAQAEEEKAVAKTEVKVRNPKLDLAMKALENIHGEKRPDLLDPFTHDIDTTVQCLPLDTAANKEKLCSYDPKDDVYISATLRRGFVWEGANVLTVKYLMDQNPDFGLIDIGTNLGIYAVTFGSLKRNYIGVECFPPTLNILSRTLRMNPHLLEHVLVVSSAISDSYDPVDFYKHASEPHPGAIETHSKKDIDQNGQPYQHKLATKIGSAKAILMDDLLPLIPFKRAIGKMDIEDGESKALAGAYKIFKEIDITHVMMEWAVKWWKRPHDAKFIIKFMQEHGYTVHKHTRPFEELTLSFEGSKKWPFDVMWIKKATAKTPS